MDFDRFSWKINEKSWIFTISQGFLGNLGVYLIQPPKICAGLLETLPYLVAAALETPLTLCEALHTILTRYEASKTRLDRATQPLRLLDLPEFTPS